MLNISKNELYIDRIDSVMQSFIPNRSIPLCRPRRCDCFVFILSGSCSYTFSSGHSFTTHEGDILYLSQNAVYSMEVHERYDFIVADFFFSGDEERKSQCFTPRDRADAENTFFKLLRRHRRGADFADCMSLLYRIYSAIIKTEQAVYMPNSTKFKLEAAKDAILQGFHGDISISSLAKTASMSEVYFRKLFRSAYDCSPSEYITNCRISYAKELLMQNYLSVSEIAEICGFSSTSYFCRVFKKCTGITPKTIVEENNEKDG